MAEVTFPIIIQGGLVWLASTTWAETGKSIINDYYPYGKDSINAKILYAIFLTLVVILVIYIIQYISKIDTNTSIQQRVNALKTQELK